jgi:glycosyltransferase involved in cell wall biosynthesis
MSKSLNILYLVPDLFGPPGGIARHGRSVCTALVNSGYAVEAIALLDGNEEQNRPSKSLVSIRYVPCRGDRKLFVRQALIALKQRPALVLVEHLNLSPVGWLVARLARARLVVVAHGIDAWEPLSFTRRRASVGADRVICVSHFTARRIAETNGVLPAKIRVLHNCLEPEQSATQPPKRTQTHPSLLTVGRMSLSEQYKGHDYVIKAMPALCMRFPDLIYDIVGSGNWQSQLQALAHELGVGDKVRFHGRVSEEELARFYANASIFIMPSRGEGFGIAFLEAMMQGIPVIGGNMDASPEVIHHNKAGLVIDPTSVDEIVEAVATLLNDAALREQMGQRGRELANGKFSFASFQGTLNKYLEEIL